MLAVRILSGVLVVVVGALSATGRAFPAPAFCAPAQLRLSISEPGIGFTGGAYAVFLVVRNVSRPECSVEGHPLVVVSPHPFPIVVGDLAAFDPNDPLIGPERLLQLRVGSSARAQAIIRRRCDGAKAEMTRTTIEFSFHGKSASLRIPACRKQGAEIDTGPFLPTG